MLYVIDIETLPIPDTELSTDLIDARENLKERERLKALRNGESEETVNKNMKFFSYGKPWFGYVALIGVLSIDRRTEVIKEFRSFCADSVTHERDMLLAFFKYIAQDVNRLYVHFNGIDFDIPFLIQRAIKYNIRLQSFGLSDFMNLTRFRTNPHFDIMQLMSSWGRNPISLDLACKHLGVASPKQTLNNQDLHSFLQSGGDYREYNRGDVLATYECFRRVYNTLEYKK